MLTNLVKYLSLTALLLAPHAEVLAADAARAAAILKGRQGESPDTINAYDRTGTVDEINLATNQIIVDDRSYVLEINVPVHDGNRSVSRTSIRKGMRLSFNTRPGSESGSGTVITEIWVVQQAR